MIVRYGAPTKINNTNNTTNNTTNKNTNNTIVGETNNNMLNTQILNNKYNSLISVDKKAFAANLKLIRSNISLKELDKDPILCYINPKYNKNALYYTLAVFHSLREYKVLSYAIITGQTLINQHFLSEDKRDDIYEEIFYNDIAFISLSEFDYTSDYLEALLIDLIEFRQRKGKLTVISYDVLAPSKGSYKVFTKNLRAYMQANSYKILDMTSTLASSFSAPTTSTQITKKGRIE
jgi:hypothetical protein